MIIDRRKIEQFTASIAVFLLSIMTVIWILFMADQIFDWDIFPPSMEKVIGFIMISAVGIIFTSILVNVMINFSIIALNLDQLVEKMITNHGKKSK